MTGVAFTIGDNNEVSVNYQKASLPEPETVDIQAELQTIKALLSELNQDENNVFIDASVKTIDDEAKKLSPDKDVVSDALETGIKYANKLNSFGGAIERLKPRVEAVAGWLGKNGHKLLPLVGLAV
ncbi:MAG: hypothetical protein HC799_15400 [Limnothrix sp. RL_2_0]|nr:hypothetical protein [Limnothrix sp. RL_2_0]